MPVSILQAENFPFFFSLGPVAQFKTFFLKESLRR